MSKNNTSPLSSSLSRSGSRATMSIQQQTLFHKKLVHVCSMGRHLIDSLVRELENTQDETKKEAESFSKGQDLDFLEVTQTVSEQNKLVRDMQMNRYF